MQYLSPINDGRYLFGNKNLLPMLNILRYGYKISFDIKYKNEFIFSKDYHVILIDKSSSFAVIYDFDSTLSFPVSAIDYFQLAIRDETNIARRYHRYILK
jgi:hypothetical protein